MKRIYHGSNKYIEKPLYDFIHVGATDYGERGFYCTQDKEAAKEWACKNADNSDGFLLEYDIDERGLKILDLTDKTRFSVLNWFALLLKHRTYSREFYSLYERRINFIIERYLNIDLDEYDVVIGYRADDAYFAFPLSFIRGELLLESLEEVFNLGELGTQYVLVSQKAFNRIKFVKGEVVNHEYYSFYQSRISSANSKYHQILKHDINSIGTRITDLMKDD